MKGLSRSVFVAAIMAGAVRCHEQYELGEELASATEEMEGKFEYGEPIMLTTHLYEEHIFDFETGKMRE